MYIYTRTYYVCMYVRLYVRMYVVDEHQWLFPRWLSSGSAKPITYLHLVQRLCIIEAIPPYPNTPSW